MCAKSLSHVQLSVTPWTLGHQAPLSMGFSRQKYWSGLPFPSPGDLPDPGIKPRSSALQAAPLLSEPPGKFETISGFRNDYGMHSINNCIYLFLNCTYLFLAVLDLRCDQGLLSSCAAQTPHCCGFSCCEAWALGAQTQQLWRMDVVALKRVGS